MNIAGGIRALSAGYYRDFTDVPDTEENLSSCIVFESADENCSVTTMNSWPDSFMLDASMNPVAIASHAILEQTKNQNSIERISIYENPKFDEQSFVKSSKVCCRKIIVRFENSGKYLLQNNAITFFGKSFADCRLDFPADCLFEKEFLFCSDSISEIVDEKGLIRHEDTLAEHKIYPYGGLFEYGMHPKQTESCVFRSVSKKNSLSLRATPLSVLQNSGIDPAADLRSESGYRFVGIKHFSPSQKINLYDELKNGGCQIEVTDKNSNEKIAYKSNGVFHTPQTNLITVNFIRRDS
jgi:hypothetical protein